MDTIIKKLTLILCTSFLIFNLNAQTKKKNIILDVGAYSGYGYKQREPFLENSGIPALSAGVEYFIEKYFSIGSYVTYTYVYDKFVGSTVRYKDVWKGWDIGIKPGFHLNPFLPEQSSNKIDIYLCGFGGFSYRALQYDRENIYRDSLNYTTNGINAGGIIGLRYLLGPKFGLYGELGKSKRWFIGGGFTFTLR